MLWQSTRISSYCKGRLLEFFSLGDSRVSFQVSDTIKPENYPQVIRIPREAIYYQQMNALSSLSGEIEIDETMFDVKVAGKRGWGSAGNRMVFGIYQRNGKVLKFPIASMGKHDLIPLMIHYTTAGDLYYTNYWHAYKFLGICGNHVVIRKGKGGPKGRDHLNGVEGFWFYTKHWLYHYCGVPKKYFYLHLKEIEWRFNHRKENLIILQRDI